MLTKFDGFVKTPTEALEETALLDIKSTKKTGTHVNSQVPVLGLQECLSI